MLDPSTIEPHGHSRKEIQVLSLSLCFFYALFFGGMGSHSINSSVSTSQVQTLASGVTIPHKAGVFKEPNQSEG